MQVRSCHQVCTAHIRSRPTHPLRKHITPRSLPCIPNICHILVLQRNRCFPVQCREKQAQSRTKHKQAQAAPSSSCNTCQNSRQRRQASTMKSCHAATRRSCARFASRTSTPASRAHAEPFSQTTKRPWLIISRRTKKWETIQPAFLRVHFRKKREPRPAAAAKATRILMPRRTRAI